MKVGGCKNVLSIADCKNKMDLKCKGSFMKNVTEVGEKEVSDFVTISIKKQVRHPF